MAAVARGGWMKVISGPKKIPFKVQKDQQVWLYTAKINSFDSGTPLAALPFTLSCEGSVIWNYKKGTHFLWQLWHMADGWKPKKFPFKVQKVQQVWLKTGTLLYVFVCLILGMDVLAGFEKSSFSMAAMACGGWMEVISGPKKIPFKVQKVQQVWLYIRFWLF